ncbi:hypothetical protein PR001_g6821 [Phytophthora rubi]|uniref:Uncharacterized protein n=1 Tax=Phytophthora rubi TaxID=129364 RepID=A0A6A3LLD0_9STRA|nr:hypothetical protein PR002_g12640 [Phytophthora rubi]KAE9040994.1 hypothetical protein PR001_g6821 [Phytophthora rubi]
MSKPSAFQRAFDTTLQDIASDVLPAATPLLSISSLVQRAELGSEEATAELDPEEAAAELDPEERRRPELDPEETRVDPDLVGAAVELNSEETAVELGLMLSGAELCLEEDMGLLDERGGRLVMVL